MTNGLTRSFTVLDADCLHEAWRRQGAAADIGKIAAFVGRIPRTCDACHEETSFFGLYDQGGSSRSLAGDAAGFAFLMRGRMGARKF